MVSLCWPQALIELDALGDMVGVDAHMRLQTFRPGSAPPVP